MKIFALFQIITIFSSGFGLNIKKGGEEEVFPVYARPVYDDPREPRSFQEGFNHTNYIKNSKKDEITFPRNDTFEIIVGSKYSVASNNKNPGVVTARADAGFQVTYDNETFPQDKLIVREYNKCAQSNASSDCFKFKTLKFLQDLVVPIPAENLR